MIGDNHDLFKPTHGSAPKYAGQYKVNPIAMLLTVKLMLEWLKETEKAFAFANGNCSGYRGRQGAHLRYGRQRVHARCR